MDNEEAGKQLDELLLEAAQRLLTASIVLLTPSKVSQPITAAAQTTAPTKADQWAVRGLAHITEPTPQSWPLGQHGIANGLAEHRSGCAQCEWTYVKLWRGSSLEGCLICGALRLRGKTLVLAAELHSSTSQKPASPSSAAPSSAASAPSASSNFRETVKEQLRLGMRPMHEDCETCEEMRRQLAVPKYSHIPEQRVRPEGETP